jgi:hypothetical protein
MKLYWLKKWVQEFLSWDTSCMKYDVTHILTSLKKEWQRYGKVHLDTHSSTTEKSTVRLKEDSFSNDIKEEPTDYEF